jgi:hypothetical protein
VENDNYLDYESDEDDEACEVGDQPKRLCELNVYETVKLWVTGKRAQFEACDSRRQLELEARKLMNKSGMVKLPNNKETKIDLAMSKKSAQHIIRFERKMKVIFVSCLIVVDAERIFELKLVQTTLSCSAAAGTAMGKIIPKISKRKKS